MQPERHSAGAELSYRFIRWGSTGSPWRMVPFVLGLLVFGAALFGLAFVMVATLAMLMRR